MPNPPKISIIVPIYNATSTLDECINSIIKQTFQSWELILVDDGSEDNSYNICMQFAYKDNRITILQQNHLGASEARNLALDAVKGEFVCFIDSDDTIEPDYLSLMYEQRNWDMVVCGYYVDIYNCKRLIKRETRNPQKIKLSYTNTKEKKNLLPLFVTGIININCNKLLKTKIIKTNNIKYCNYQINEDYIFMLKYMMYAKSISSIEKPLYHWRHFKNKKSNVNSIPENLLAIYNEAHLLTRFFFDDNKIADTILYYSYNLIVIKYFNAITEKTLSPKKVFIKLREFHKNALVQASYNAYRPTSLGEIFIHWLQKKGYFRCYYILYRILTR